MGQETIAKDYTNGHNPNGQHQGQIKSKDILKDARNQGMLEIEQGILA
jgi:hypothetical protein